MALTDSEMDLCNMVLARIGAKRLEEGDLAANTKIEAIHCNLQFEQTRDALLRSYRWRFAAARIRLASAWVTARAYTTDQYVSYSSVWYKCKVAHTSLTAGGDGAGGEPDTNTTQWTAKTSAEMTPAFEWDNQFDLPADYLARGETWEDNNPQQTLESYAIEGTKYLTDEDTVDLKYTRKVTTTSDFEPLFIEVMVLQMGLKLIMPLAGDKSLYEQLKEELYGSPRRPGVMSKVRAMDKQEQNTVGYNDMNTWNAARLTNNGRTPTKLGC